MEANMNILVTGGAGFIGSHLTDALVDEGHRVAVVDNLSTGERNQVNPKADFYGIDLLDGTLPAVFAQEKPEIVFHLAAHTDVQASLKKPVRDAQVNVLGTLNLLQQCAEHKVRKIIYSSSAAVYGNPEYLGVDERHPLKPVSFYGVSKLVPEQYLAVFSRLYDLDYTILRYANVYGERQGNGGEGGVVSIFFERMSRNKTPVIFGDGEQTRDFIYVKDVISANLAALARGSCETFNIGCNTETAINDLLKEIYALNGQAVHADYRPGRAGDIIRSRLDNRSAQNGLVWKPVYTLQEGLAATAQGHLARIQDQLRLR
jgi:UDP-glucose 4-epimerase